MQFLLFVPSVLKVWQQLQEGGIACLSPALVVLQGLNATLFVYGQTGSGKTYTMQQIVRLAAMDIFEAIQELPDREFLLKLTAVEIYNEKVRDLLAESADKQNLSLVEDTERGVVAEGSTDVSLETVDQLGKLLKTIEARRTVRSFTQ